MDSNGRIGSSPSGSIFLALWGESDGEARTQYMLAPIRYGATGRQSVERSIATWAEFV